jgi:hypothetical protein
MWVDEPGRPVVRTELDMRDGRVQRLALQQRDPSGRDRLWPQQLRVTVGCGALPRCVVAELVGREIDLTASLADCVPDYVLAGGEGWGYGEFELDARSLAYLQTGIPAIGDRRSAGSQRRLVRLVGRAARRSHRPHRVVRHGDAEPEPGARCATHR